MRRVKDIGGIAYKFVSPAHRGVADRLVVLPGGVVWFVEVKRVENVAFVYFYFPYCATY